MTLRPPDRQPRAGILVLGLLATLVAGCSEPAPPPGPGEARAAAPVGREEYERLMATESGTALSSTRLRELAEDAELRIETEMDRVAERLGEETDWRPVFAEIRRDHPATAAEVLAAYRDQIDAGADFLAARDWMTLPPLKPGVLEAESGIVRRAFPLALYMNGSLAVVTAAGDEADPEYLANHCRVCIPPLAVHEAYPGHHVAFYHAAANRAGVPLGEPVEIRGQPENFFFHEGWGLYAELLMLGAGYYQDPSFELAAWRMILLRATRARIDAALHAGELPAADAIHDYQELLMMDRDAAATEVRRHLRRPTNKATYFVGLLQIQALKRQAFARASGLDVHAFHDRLLARPRRLSEVAREEFGFDLADLAPLELPEGPAG